MGVGRWKGKERGVATGMQHWCGGMCGMVLGVHMLFEGRGRQVINNENKEMF